MEVLTLDIRSNHFSSFMCMCTCVRLQPYRMHVSRICVIKGPNKVHVFYIIYYTMSFLLSILIFTRDTCVLCSTNLGQIHDSEYMQYFYQILRSNIPEYYVQQPKSYSSMYMCVTHGHIVILLVHSMGYMPQIVITPDHSQEPRVLDEVNPRSRRGHINTCIYKYSFRHCVLNPSLF